MIRHSEHSENNKPGTVIVCSRCGVNSVADEACSHSYDRYICEDCLAQEHDDGASWFEELCDYVDE